MHTHPSRSIRLASLVALSMVAVISHAQTVMTRHVREVVRSAQVLPLGRLPPDQMLDLDVVLPLGDSAGLKRFLADVYNPASPNYRRFVNPQRFTALFGPSQKSYDAVVQFAKSNGFAVLGGTRDGMELQIRGPASVVEHAFHLQMNLYKHPTENRTFYAPDREPTHALPFPLWQISGLDNFSVPQPLLVRPGAQRAAARKSAAPAVTGSGPGYGYFLGSDMRAAYYGGTALTGAGQNMGLLEFAGTNLTDVSTYFANTGQTNGVPITLLSTDGSSTSCTYPACDDYEQTLDITQAVGMAPKLASLTLYIGDVSNNPTVLAAMTTHNPLPMTISSSWTWSPADPTAADPYFLKMAAQGQTFFQAAGDNRTWSQAALLPCKYVYAADDPYVVSVGGTSLVTSGAGGPWSSEVAWGNGEGASYQCNGSTYSNPTGSGGGVSTDGFAIPWWQTLSGVIGPANGGSAQYRNGPDVSANADYTFYVCGDQLPCVSGFGGTSFAAPMWAAYTALLNQQLAASGQNPVGFLNPTIYQQNLNAATYAEDFHDITTGTSGSYGAVQGYDLVTGWGSPTANLVNLLSQTRNNSTIQVESIAAGSTHACAVTAAGGVACWGYNNYGQLGNGTVNNATTPVSVTGLSSGVMAVTAGSNQTCALSSAGAVECWGWNAYGQLGNGTGNNSTTPTLVTGLSSGVVAISAGYYHTCALTAIGDVLCWGYNQEGELGNGSTTSSSVPVRVTGLSGVAAIAAGDQSTCALQSTGAVYCWGYNNYGQLGNGTTTTSSTPVPVTGLSGGVAAIAAGWSHACAIMNTGAMVCWGYNGYGELGNGGTTSSNVPVAVSGLSAGVVSMSANQDDTCAVSSAGTIFCWGSNSYGQLGNGTTSNSSTPVAVFGLSSGIAVAAGNQMTCAATSTGAVQCWGYNEYGQLGNGTGSNSTTPILIPGLTASTGGGGGSNGASGETDGPLPLWAIGALGAGLVGIARRRLKKGTRTNT